MNNEEERRNWLMHVMNYYGRYHDHKETMAWAATAFFIPSIISFAVASGHIGNEHCIFRMLFSIWLVIPFIILACVWAWYFVGWQFSKRRVAGDNAFYAVKELKDKYPEDKFPKFDDPPEGYKSEILSRLAIVGATVVAIVIVGVGIL